MDGNGNFVIFYLNSALNFGILSALVFQLEVYYKEDRLQIGLTAQQKGTTARWYSNKTFLFCLLNFLGTPCTCPALCQDSLAELLDAVWDLLIEV